jgi:methylenetetrahydrofolate reductase (NADPH)
LTRIADLLDQGPTLSFEFFPPKSPEAEQQLRTALAELAPLEPSFVSVTYGALGSTRDTTREIVIEVNDRYPFPAMAHLTCVGHTRAEIADLLEGYAEAGVENILALAGDPPADGSDAGGDFVYALELVELVREAGGFSVGVAAHPELHPRSEGDREADRLHLAAKLRAADFGITQFFFDADHYFRMADELAARSCSTPVLAGVMPFLTVPGVRRMAAMNNTAIPDWLSERLDAVDGDPRAVRDLGVEVSVALCERLLAGGVPGLHLYALNRSEAATEIVRTLGLG